MLVEIILVSAKMILTLLFFGLFLFTHPALSPIFRFIVGPKIANTFTLFALKIGHASDWALFTSTSHFYYDIELKAISEKGKTFVWQIMRDKQLIPGDPIKSHILISFILSSFSNPDIVKIFEAVFRERVEKFLKDQEDSLEYLSMTTVCYDSLLQDEVINSSNLFYMRYPEKELFRKTQYIV